MAAAFARCADFQGSYTRLEINATWVQECNRRIGRSNQRFLFVHADVHHPYYNAGGNKQAQSYVLPCGDGMFDCAIANSVFTHLLPNDAKHYLEEMHRILAPEGLAYIRWYVIGEDYYLNRKTAKYCLQVPGDGYFSTDEDMHESVVGYPEKQIYRLLEETRLEIRKRVPGHWCREKLTLDQHDQDILIVGKV